MPLRIFEPKKEEEKSASIKLYNDEQVICALQNISLGRSSKDFVIDWICISYWAELGCEYSRERDHLKDLYMDL